MFLFEMGVNNENTVSTSMFFDNLYVVPAYEFKDYVSDYAINFSEV